MKICHLIEIPEENIYWNTSESDIVINGQTYEAVGDTIAVSVIPQTALEPHTGSDPGQYQISLTFAIDEKDVAELNSFINGINHTAIAVSLISIEGL